RDESITPSATDVVFWCDGASSNRLDAERLKQSPAHICAGYRIDAARVGQVERRDLPRRRALEEIVLAIPDLFPDRVGPRCPIDDDQLSGVFNSELLHHDVGEDREQGCVGTDPER